MTSDAEIREAAAEAVVFAHESWAAIPNGIDTAELRALEHTAALAAAAFAGSAFVPKRLQDRLAATGLSFCAERCRAAPPGSVRRLRAAQGRVAGLLGLAACLALAWVLWANRDEGVHPQTRATLLTADKEAVRLAWKGGSSLKSGAVTGDVVWSQARQAGFLSFRGLPPLDAEHRFQLWIVDGTREGAPVDGGLFVIADAGIETVVPVQARLPIGKAAAFVVTVEPKHGVVVSKQQHVVAIAGL